MVSGAGGVAPPAAPRVPPVLAFIGILLLAANLRAAVNVLGPILPLIRADLGLSGLQVGMITALPSLCFGVVGLLGARVSAVFGPTRTVLAALIVMTVGQLARAALPGVAALFFGTGVALSAIAVANVVTPALIATYFPHRVHAMTGAYTVTLAGLGAAASSGTLPIQAALDAGWRVGIGIWAVIAIVALIPWLLIARHGTAASHVPGRHLGIAEMAKVPRAWVLAFFFGVQALQAYVVFSWYPTMLADAGLPLARGAAYVGLVSLASMIGSLVLPNVMHRLRDPRPLVLAINLCFILGYLGTIFAPLAAPWLWAFILGIGTVCFPMGLYLVTQRARTGAGVLALSGFMQGLGYTLAAIGLVVLGAWQGDSPNWTPLLVFLIVLTVIQAAAALPSAGDWKIEDELGHEAEA